MNAPILTGGQGHYYMKKITLEVAKKIWNTKGVKKLSAIGHQATADLCSLLLEDKIEVNRIPFEQQTSDICIVMKMKQRIPEGTVLNSIESIEKIGYEFYSLMKED